MDTCRTTSEVASIAWKVPPGHMPNNALQRSGNEMLSAITGLFEASGQLRRSTLGAAAFWHNMWSPGSELDGYLVQPAWRNEKSADVLVPEPGGKARSLRGHENPMFGSAGQLRRSNLAINSAGAFCAATKRPDAKRLCCRTQMAAGFDRQRCSPELTAPTRPDPQRDATLAS